MQEESGEAKNNGNSKSNGKSNGKGKKKANTEVHSRSAPTFGQVAVQKRKATESVTNSITGTSDGDRGHALKRHKSDAARPHPEFWYPDGSVIIQVENTEFRLHQSILQKKSAYFAAAFAKDGGRAYLDAQSPNGHHLPVYRVVETAADDFAALLTMIENPFRVGIVRCMPLLAGALRAARALSFEMQRKWAEHIFEHMWSARLITLKKDPAPHAVVALVLARTCGLRGVQKRASYELLRMPRFGQAIVASPAVHVEMQEDSRADSKADAETGLDELPRVDLLRLLHAREQLVLAWAKISGRAPTDFICPRGTQTQITSESGGGTTSTSSSNDGHHLDCASASADRVNTRWVELVHTTGLYVQRMNDPLMGLQDLMEIPWEEEGFCEECVAARTNTWHECRNKLWSDLEVWLELTG